MSKADKILSVVREWIWKAETDMKSPVYLLERKEDCPADSVCFHAQQCVEKYLKAFLVLSAGEFPKTHNLKELVSLLPSGARVSLAVAEQDRLTEYATVTRYPGDYEPIPVAEARKAVSIARRVRRGMRKLFPRAALRRRRKC